MVRIFVNISSIFVSHCGSWSNIMICTLWAHINQNILNWIKTIVAFTRTKCFLLLIYFLIFWLRRFVSKIHFVNRFRFLFTVFVNDQGHKIDMAPMNTQGKYNIRIDGYSFGKWTSSKQVLYWRCSRSQAIGFVH